MLHQEMTSPEIEHQLSRRRSLPHVLLISPDERERQLWRAALASSCVLHECAHLDEASALAATAGCRVVVLRAQDGVDAWIEGRSFLRALRIGARGRESLAPAADNVIDVEDDRMLAERVSEIVSPTRSSLARHKVVDTRARWRGRERFVDVVDLSCDGLSFRVGAELDSPLLLPGSVLPSLELARHESRVLAEVDATVRHLVPVPHGYLVGCSLAPTPRLCPMVAPRTITSAGRIVGLLRSALARGAVQLERLSGGGRTACKGAVDAAAGVVSLEPARELACERFDVLRGRLDADGTSYRFFTAVCERSPLIVRLPEQIEEAELRRTSRFRPGPGEPAIVEIGATLCGPAVARELLDIHTGGFSFEAASDRDVFPLGLLLPRLRLRLGDGELCCDGVVRSLQARGGGSLRVGVQVSALDIDAYETIADFVMRGRTSAAEDGRDIAFDRLWDFFRESRVVDGDRELALRPLMPEVKRTFSALTARPNKLFKSIVVKDRDHARILAHVGGLRAYSGTWYAGHLGSIPTRGSGHAVNGAAAYFCQDSAYRNGFMHYYPHNKWPVRVFGTFGRRPDPAVSCVEELPFFTASTALQLPTPRDIVVAEATSHDLLVLEQHFVRTSSQLLIETYDLTRAGLRLEEVSERFRELGLMRERKILVAFTDSGPLGFCLLELSSPGLNLQEWFSSCQVIALPDGERADSEVIAALVGRALQTYAQHGRQSARIFIDDKHAGAMFDLGIVQRASVMRWSMGRGVSAALGTALEELLGDPRGRPVGPRARRRNTH